MLLVWEKDRYLLFASNAHCNLSYFHSWRRSMAIENYSCSDWLISDLKLWLFHPGWLANIVWGILQSDASKFLFCSCGFVLRAYFWLFTAANGHSIRWSSPIYLYKPISHPSVVWMSREINFLSFNTSPKPTGNDHVISLITIVLPTFPTRYQWIFYGYTSSTELKTS